MTFIRLTRPTVEAFVRDNLMTNGSGRVATRLLLVEDGPNRLDRCDLGGLCERAVVDRLCEFLGVGEAGPCDTTPKP